MTNSSQLHEDPSKQKTAMPKDLVTNAPPLAKEVLNYCDIDATSFEHAKKLNNKFTVAHIQELAEYLKFDLTPRPDSTSKKGYRNLKVLVHRCLLKIKSYTFPSTCGACKEQYTVDHSKVPSFTCWICMQGSHECEATLKTKSTLQSLSGGLQGFHWLCAPCCEKTDTSLSSMNPFANEKERLDPALDVVTEAQVTAKDESGAGLTITHATKKPCPYLANGRCRHGMSGKIEIDGKTCPHLHRKVCRRYKMNGLGSKYGCKKGKDCTKLHPKLCEGSRRKMKDRICVEKDCPHLHLKGTRRTTSATSPEDPAPLSYRRVTRSSESAANYQVPMSSSPLRPASQQSPQHVQSGFLSIFLKEVRDAREESLRQADRMDEIMAQLIESQDESPMLHSQVIPQSLQYPIPRGMTLTQGLRKPILSPQTSRRCSY